jgi:hypothetical protein
MSQSQHDHQAEEQSPVISVASLPREKAPGFSEVYANTANLVAGFFDVCLLFGTIEADLAAPAEQRLRIQDRVAVKMSWEHAKALLGLLQMKIEDYEKNFGGIRNRPPQQEIEA